MIQIILSKKLLLEILVSINKGWSSVVHPYDAGHYLLVQPPTWTKPKVRGLLVHTKRSAQ